MPEQVNKCLYDQWHTATAPVFHMSKLWPAFSEAQIKDFLTSQDNQPTATTPLNEADARAYSNQIERFLEAIRPLSENEYPCKQAYVDFEHERLMLLNLVLNAQDQDKVEHYNDHLYGSLDSLHRGEVLGYLKHYIENLDPRAPTTAGFRNQLLDHWQDAKSSDAITRRFIALDQQKAKIQPFVEQKFSYLEKLLAPYPEAAVLNSEQACEILRQSIPLILGSQTSGWGAVTKPGAPNVHLDYEARAVTVPAGRLFAREHVKALAIHEIGVHVVRSVNGENSRERLAGYGMAGYGAAEEALGALMGNVGRPHASRISSLISFAVIDFANRPSQASTFRRVHQLTAALMICVANPSETALREKDYEYKRLAFSRVIRVLRHGTGAVVDRSTTKYWRGLLLLSEYFEKEGLTQASLDQFFLGKYDCLNKSQLQLIQTHTIS